MLQQAFKEHALVSHKFYISLGALNLGRWVLTTVIISNVLHLESKRKNVFSQSTKFQKRQVWIEALSSGFWRSICNLFFAFNKIWVWIKKRFKMIQTFGPKSLLVIKHDSETKQESSKLRTTNSPWLKKARQMKSNVNCGILHWKFVSLGQTWFGLW